MMLLDGWEGLVGYIIFCWITGSRNIPQICRMLCCFVADECIQLFKFGRNYIRRRQFILLLNYKGKTGQAAEGPSRGVQAKRHYVPAAPTDWEWWVLWKSLSPNGFGYYFSIASDHYYQQ